MKLRLAPIEKIAIKLFLFICAIFIGMYMRDKMHQEEQDQTYSINTSNR